MKRKEKDIKKSREYLAKEAYEGYLKKKKVYFNPKKRSAREQNNHIISLQLKKMIAKEKLEIKYEDYRKPKEYSFQPTINYNSREIAKDIKKTLETSRSKISTGSRDFTLLTTVRSKSSKSRRKFLKSPALMSRSRTKSRVVFKHDGGIQFPGNNDFENYEKSIKEDNEYPKRRSLSNAFSRRKANSRSLKRRIRYGEKSYEPKRKVKRTVSQKSNVLGSRRRSSSRIVQRSQRSSNLTSRREIKNNPNNQKKILNQSLDIENVHFFQSNNRGLETCRERIPFNNIIESSNRMHLKAREYMLKKKQVRKESTENFFKPNTNVKKEICKENVRRLIQVLDMRFNKLNRVTNKEKIKELEVSDRLIHTKIPNQLYEKRKRFL